MVKSLMEFVLTANPLEDIRKHREHPSRHGQRATL